MQKRVVPASRSFYFWYSFFAGWRLRPQAKRAPYGRLFQVFLMKLLPHLGQEMLILPLPRGTRSFCLQVGQLNTL